MNKLFNVKGQAYKLLPCLLSAFLFGGCNDNQPAEKIGCSNSTEEYTQVGFENSAGDCEIGLYVKRQEYADSGVIAQLDAYTSNGYSGGVTWEQIDGPNATIVNHTALNAQVLMPYVQESQLLTFEVTIQNGANTSKGTQIVTVLPLDAPFSVETPAIGEQSNVIRLATKSVPDGTVVVVDFLGGTAVEGVDFNISTEGPTQFTVENQRLNIPVTVLPSNELINQYVNLALILPSGKVAAISVVIVREPIDVVPSSSVGGASSETAAVSSAASETAAVSSAASSSSAQSSVSSNTIPVRFENACRAIMPSNVEYPERVNNPYLDADLYVDPDFQANVTSTQNTLNDGELHSAMEIIKTQSTAVWVENTEQLCGTSTNGRLNLVEHIDNALAGLNDSSLTMTLTVYDIPGREFGTKATGAGDFDLTEQGQLGYRQFIDSLAAIMASAPELRFVVVLEPHVLAKLADEMIKMNVPSADSYITFYKNNLAYGLWRFSQTPNIYVYLDVANPAWVDIDLKESALVKVANEILSLSAEFTDAGTVQFSGFVANTLNYIPYAEPFVSQEYRDSYSDSGRGALSIVDYMDNLRLIMDDYPSLPKTFLVDSSRNGWGGPNRPTEVGSTSSFRLERRSSRDYWCNIKTAGLGEFPKATPDPEHEYVQAFFWFKPPGESDGMETGSTFGCASDSSVPNAPAGGEWFDIFFIQLIEFSWPQLLGTSNTN